MLFRSLGPALRPPHQAINVARRLTMKAAARLRRMGYTATAFGFSARLEDGRKLRAESHCHAAQDSPAFLSILLNIWSNIIPHGPGIAVKKISVALWGLEPENSAQLLLFDDREAEARPERPMRSMQISRALDRLNRRFGRDTVLIGMMPSAGKGFSGSKIAFTRIPDREEFLE